LRNWLLHRPKEPTIGKARPPDRAGRLRAGDSPPCLSGPWQAL